MSKILIVLCAFLMLTFTPSVNADPLVVTSGSLGPLESFFDGPNYSLFGENFSLFGGGGPGSIEAAKCVACQSGGLIGVSAFFAGSGLGGGTFILDGMTFSGVVFAGTLAIWN